MTLNNKYLRSDVGMDAPAPERAVMAAGQQLNGNISDLESMLRELADRLQPVLRIEPTSASEKDMIAGGATPLACEILSQAQRVRRMTNDIRSVLDLLEI